MLQIAISSDLAAEHAGFVAECAERGHRVEVFGSCEETKESAGSAQATRALATRHDAVAEERSGRPELADGR